VRFLTFIYQNHVKCHATLLSLKQIKSCFKFHSTNILTLFLLQQQRIHRWSDDVLCDTSSITTLWRLPDYWHPRLWFRYISMSILQRLRYVKLLTSTRLLTPTSMVSINQYVNITTPQVCQIVNTRLLTPTSMGSINQYVNITTPQVCQIVNTRLLTPTSMVSINQYVNITTSQVCQIVNIYQITDSHVYGFDKSICQYYNASGMSNC
jgi:hypothetical protein